MDLQTITLPGDTEQERREAARKAFLEYQRAVKERHDAEDEAIMRGYKAISQGKQLISLSDTIKAGGIDDNGRPRLAIMRADQRWCYFETRWEGWIFSNDGQDRARHRNRFRFPRTVLPLSNRWVGAGDRRPTAARAIVPIVPPGLRPSISLGNFHILWEAAWEDVPSDPALLRHIGGELYAVVAVWDLTELERAVLGGRLREE